MAADRDNRVLITEFKALLDRAKSDAAVFAVMTVILTPVFVIGVIIALFFALSFVDLPIIDHLGFQGSVLTGVNLTVGFMLASYFLNPNPSGQRCDGVSLWDLAAFSLFCGLLCLSYTVPLVKTQPVSFWLTYLFCALVMFGCLGKGYEPRDDYYLGWVAGPLLFDDPFTFQDDIDRAHLSLGFLVSLSHLILQSYGSICGSTWLWHSLEFREISGAVELLRALASNDPARAQARIRTLSRSSAADIVRTLVKLEMVMLDRGKPRLTLKGREFLTRGSLDP